MADYVATVGLAPNGFSYDAATRTATWTFNEAFAADKLLVQLDDSATDTLGALLDGEWTDVTSTFSGDGTAGGDFRFRFNILPGDVNGSGQVNVADVQANRAAQFRGLGHAQYNPRHDVDGNGHVNATDLVLVRDFSLTSLPAGEPTAGGSPSAAAGAVVAAARSSDAAIGASTVRPSRTRVVAAAELHRRVASKSALEVASPATANEASGALRARRNATVRARHDAALQDWRD